MSGRNATNLSKTGVEKIAEQQAGIHTLKKQLAEARAMIDQFDTAWRQREIQYVEDVAQLLGECSHNVSVAMRQLCFVLGDLKQQQDRLAGALEDLRASHCENSAAADCLPNHGAA